MGATRLGGSHPRQSWVGTIAFVIAYAIAIGSGRAEMAVGAQVAGVIGMRLYGPDDQLTERGLRLTGGFVVDEELFSLRAEGRVRWNDAYRTNDSYSKVARDAYLLDVDWRELYASTQLFEWRASAGLQQVVWGRADQLRVLDQVNPLDLREFVLPDLNDTRRPVPMLRLNGAIADWEVELIYLPAFVPTRFAVPGSEFYIPLIDTETRDNFDVLPSRNPPATLRNGEVGVHVGTTFGPVDASFVVFQTRDDDPVFRVVPVDDADGGLASALLPVYRRKLLLGAGMSLPTDLGLVIRAESTFVPNQTYMASNADDGLTKSEVLTGLLGLDYGYTDWLFAIQASDRLVLRWDDAYVVPEHSPIFTLSVTGSTMSAKLEARAALAVMPLHGDGAWLQLRPTYKPDDHWALALGADLLAGNEAGLFGQFGRNGRIRAELRYTF